jgi:DNA polymerase (family X)
MQQQIDKRSVARALDEISRYLELSDTNKFRAIAFRNAARKVEDITTDIQSFVASGAVNKTAGIGKAIGPMIVELVETGSLRYLDELRSQYPPGILQLVKVPGMGMKKIQVLYEQLGIGDVDALERACRNNELVSLPGFGKKTQQKILDGIQFLKTHIARFLLPRGVEAADALGAHLREVKGMLDVEVAGAVRRRLEVITSVEICVSAKQPAKVASEILEAGLLGDATLAGDSTVTGYGRGDVPATIYITTPTGFDELLFVTTGSDEFVQAAGTGKRRAGAMKVPPELRETPEWLERKVPHLVSLEDLRGTFHNHTTYSDGRATLEEMLTAAKERGLEYIGISDHSKVAAYAGGLTEDRVEMLRAEIDSLRERFAPMRIFFGTEADILGDGEIDYGPKTLAGFDFVVASVHSNFKMPEREMTARMVCALENPYVTFLGHMTGRLLLAREGYAVDHEQIFKAAVRNGVIIEINGNPRRLDVDWRHMQRAAELGVIFSIHPDAHSVAEYNYLQTGVWAARKGGLEPRHIFNTLGTKEVAAYLQRKRRS